MTLAALRRLALGEIRPIDAHQEKTRLADLPESVQNYFAEKGRLDVSLKVINDGAHELHAGDPAHAGKFNLKILHRNHGRHATAHPTTPTDIQPSQHAANPPGPPTPATASAPSPQK